MANRDGTLGGILKTLRTIGWTPGAIIDIGIAHGTEGLYTVWPGVPIVLVEPSPGSAKFLDQIAGMFPNVKTYKVGASNQPGVMKFRTDPTGVYTVIGDHKPKWREIEVPVMRCDEIVADAGVKGPFLYKLDTDAHEMEIIKGSSETLKNTDLCVIEINFFYPMVGLAPPVDIIAAMAKRGFDVLDMTPVGYSTIGVGRTCDMIFVRRDSELFKMAWRNSSKTRRERPDEVSI